MSKRQITEEQRQARNEKARQRRAAKKQIGPSPFDEEYVRTPVISEEPEVVVEAPKAKTPKPKAEKAPKPEKAPKADFSMVAGFVSQRTNRITKTTILVIDLAAAQAGETLSALAGLNLEDGAFAAYCVESEAVSQYKSKSQATDWAYAPVWCPTCARILKAEGFTLDTTTIPKMVKAA